jgi:hypothetical protein
MPSHGGPWQSMQINLICARRRLCHHIQVGAQIGGSRATAATCDHHAARLVLQWNQYAFGEPQPKVCA